MSDKINACFISYRHTGVPDAHKYVQSFYDILKTQLALFLPNPSIYFDENGLKVGDLYNDELAYELCQSTSMVMLFSPSHFDPKHPYCAQEYHAMRNLEESRLKALEREQQNSGLIFPIVIRGWDYLPKEIVDNRQCENFQHIIRPSDFKKVESLKKIMILCDLIEKRYSACINAGVFTNCDCKKFRFPNKEEIMPWLEKNSHLQYPPNMPGR